MAQILQSIGAIVVGAFLGWELGKLLYIIKYLRTHNEDEEKEEN